MYPTYNGGYKRFDLTRYIDEVCLPIYLFSSFVHLRCSTPYLRFFRWFFFAVVVIITIVVVIGISTDICLFVSLFLFLEFCVISPLSILLAANSSGLILSASEETDRELSFFARCCCCFSPFDLFSVSTGWLCLSFVELIQFFSLLIRDCACCLLPASQSVSLLFRR